MKVYIDSMMLHEKEFDQPLRQVFQVIASNSTVITAQASNTTARSRLILT
ncbi:hypothetical protein [Paenibacillus periandrae]|nr:hypothetical protein [Paenibacillus periandrae]